MITISLRSYSSHIKSLLHFNYPYYAEAGDGLGDEIDAFTWTRSGSAKLCGSEIPADLIISGTPKFGYRCLHTESNSDFITGTSSASLSLSELECSLWIRLTATGTGNILQLKSGSSVILTLSVNASNQITVASSALEVNYSVNQAISLNAWTHIRMQVSASTVSIFINGAASGSVSTNKSAIPAFNTITLGGLHGEIDEFVLRDAFTSGLPTEPEKAVCNVSDLGGFGSGKLGDVTLNAACVMNTSAKAALSSGKTQISASYARAGKFGSFAAGNEVMLLNMETGEYECRTISETSGSALKVSEAFTMFNNGTQIFQVIQIPHFNSLIVNAGITISPNAWDGYSGGIIAFRVKGNCTINGNIITSGKGRPRTDLLQITHSKLIDQFITNTGGGIFIACGGTFTAPSTARLGAAWDGSAKAGVGGVKTNGTNGGAGYGGGGAGDNEECSTGGSGGVGGGGGGGNFTWRSAGDAGSLAICTGGQSIDIQAARHPGGTQGKTSGGNSERFNATGGGGAGGYGAASTSNDLPGIAGTNIILITKTLKVDAAAVSTGGGGGHMEQHTATGGGGTGFCYIACERMI